MAKEKYVILFGEGIKKTEELFEKRVIELPTYSGPYSSFNRENPRDNKIMHELVDAGLHAHQNILDAKLINEERLKITLPKKSYRTYELN